MLFVVEGVKTISSLAVSSKTIKRQLLEKKLRDLEAADAVQQEECELKLKAFQQKKILMQRKFEIERRALIEKRKILERKSYWLREQQKLDQKLLNNSFGKQEKVIEKNNVENQIEENENNIVKRDEDFEEEESLCLKNKEEVTGSLIDENIVVVEEREYVSTDERENLDDDRHSKTSAEDKEDISEPLNMVQNGKDVYITIRCEDKADIILEEQKKFNSVKDEYGMIVALCSKNEYEIIKLENDALGGIELEVLRDIELLTHVKKMFLNGILRGIIGQNRCFKFRRKFFGCN